MLDWQPVDKKNWQGACSVIPDLYQFNLVLTGMRLTCINLILSLLEWVVPHQFNLVLTGMGLTRLDENGTDSMVIVCLFACYKSVLNWFYLLYVPVSLLNVSCACKL